jgi:hypothetical protein
MKKVVKKSATKKALPKAQLGLITKTIKGAAKGAVKGGKSALKAARKEASAAKSKGFGESGQYARASDMRKSDNYRAGRGYSDPVGDRDDANKVKLVGMAAIGTAAGAGMLANRKSGPSKKSTTNKKTKKNK